MIAHRALLPCSDVDGARRSDHRLVHEHKANHPNSSKHIWAKADNRYRDYIVKGRGSRRTEEEHDLSPADPRGCRRATWEVSGTERARKGEKEVG